MKNNLTFRRIFGWTLLIIISLLPVCLWFTLGAGMSEFRDYSTITHSLGELLGLVGMTMFALTFLLSTRIKVIEELFGGLDKVYVVHGTLGGLALIFILFHPILLVLKFIPSNVAQAAKYLLPASGAHWPVNFGIISLIGLLFLIFLTLFTRLRYNKWKFSHEFLGLVFIFAVIHIFLVRVRISGDLIFKGYYVYAIIVSLLGLLAFCYSLFIKDWILKNAVYTIKRINKIKDQIFEIVLVPQKNPISYESGQFVFLRFYNKELGNEQHPFSIASKSNAQELKIIIKNLGDYTSKLGILKIGQEVAVEGPYGRFSTYANGKEQIWIAAGIGITPFLGLIEDLKENKEGKKIDLYYSVSKAEDFVSYDFIIESASKIKNFRFIPWESSLKGRISVEDIDRISNNLTQKEFLICGNEKFKEDLINVLIKKGVKKENIYEEDFRFR